MPQTTATGTSMPHSPRHRTLLKAAAVLSAVVAATAPAACTDTDRGDHPLKSRLAAEERLDFVWDEAIEVPAGQRPPVEVAREWMYGYHLWHTGIEHMPAQITENTADEDLYPIGGSTPPPKVGPVLVTLVELEIGDAEGTVGVCSDSTNHTAADSDGQPLPYGGGGVIGRWLNLARNDAGQWLLVGRGTTQELHEVCDEL